MRPPSHAFAVIVALLPFLGGCSLIFVEGPPENHAELEYFPCTEGRTLPWLDVIGAGLNAVDAGVALADDAASERDVRNARIASGIAGAAILGVSASVGFNRVAECRAAKLEAARRASGLPETTEGVSAALAPGDVLPMPRPPSPPRFWVPPRIPERR